MNIMRCVASRDSGFTDTIAVHAGHQDARGELHAAIPAQFVPVPSGGSVAGPCLTLSRDAAQELMDSLWRCGVRPADIVDSAGALEAAQRHIADLRAVAFHKLGIKEPAR